MSYIFVFFTFVSLFFCACGQEKSLNSNEEVINSSSSLNTSSSSLSSFLDDSTSVCVACDSYKAAAPTLAENGGWGSVTTYGSVKAQESSQGGACNYGATRIKSYAAIHVNVEAGDNKGPWQGGLACGACVKVKAKTPEGLKSTIVRITDKCPDEYCGVDLGGAPAYELMGEQVGRYEGEWEFVSCEGVAKVFDDSTAIFIKEGSSAYWSIIQVRNAPDALKSMQITRQSDKVKTDLSMATEAENFWKIPTIILSDSSVYALELTYVHNQKQTWFIKGSDLSQSEALLYLNEF